MNRRTTEVWTLQQISDALQNLEHEQKKIVIPRFQRGQRWDSKQEDAFIDSVRKGFPVGTLLFYKTIEQQGSGSYRDVYTLVDGLQRSTAIFRYMREPMKYFGEAEVTEDYIDDVFAALGFADSQKRNLAPVISKAFVSYIHGLSSYVNPQAYPLAKSILKQIAVQNAEEVMDKLINCLSAHLTKRIMIHEEIAKSEIPAVVYLGDENDLPEIFNRINSKGTPLNAYEIYAASWPQNNKISISNDRIIDYILAKYDALNDDIYTLKGYDRDAIRTQREVTLFEYVFGFSKWLSVAFPIVAFDKNLKADEISSVGFELLDACFHDSKKIGEVYKALQNRNVNHLENALIECIKIVDSIISPITRFKGNRRKDAIRPIYAKSQILSIIAYVFRERYTINDWRHVKPDWCEKEPAIRKRIFAHFVYDIISAEWDQGGTKLHTAISSGKYHEDIPASAWESALTNMFEREKTSQERKNVSNASNADIAFLNCIYLTRYTAMDQLSPGKFDIEHIATKDLMKDLIRTTSDSGGLPISSVANLCYLPEFENRSKGRKTFYQDNGYLSRVTLQEIEEKYSFTQKDDLEWVNLPFYMGDFEDLKNEYYAFLQKRFAIQKSKFYEAMGINPKAIGQALPPPRDATDNRARANISATYEPIVDSLSLHFGRPLSHLARTIVIDEENEIGAILSYSKMYPQGIRRKYWFALHPNKIAQCAAKQVYYVFTCSDDNVAVAFPIAYLTSRLEYLNTSNPDDPDKKYYHVVLFAAGDKVTWLLSKPEVREVDVSEFVIGVRTQD